MERSRLVVSLLDNSQEFQRFQANDAQRIGDSLGFDVDVVFAANSAQLQSLQLGQILQRETRPAAILAETVAGGGLETVARDATRKGIGWILINRRATYMQTLRREHPELPIGTVSGDQIEIGRLQGRQLLAVAAPAGTHVLYVQGPADTSAAQDRLEGMRNVLATATVPIHMAIIHGDWTEASGETVVATWLASRRAAWRRWLGRESWMPQIIVCQNDHMAVGARRAAMAAGLAAPLLGVDGLPEGGQKLVDTGDLTATVIVPPNTGPAIHMVAKKLRSGEPLPAEVLMSPLSYPKLATLAGRALRGQRETTH